MSPEQIITTLRRKWLDTGLTLKQIGDRAGMPLQHVSVILNGKQGAQLTTLCRLADALDMEVAVNDKPC